MPPVGGDLPGAGKGTASDALHAKQQNGTAVVPGQEKPVSVEPPRPPFADGMTVQKDASGNHGGIAVAGAAAGEGQQSAGEKDSGQTASGHPAAPKVVAGVQQAEGQAKPSAQAAGPAPEAGRVPDPAFVVTKHSGTSIEVNVEPEGIGKLNIGLKLDGGVVNATIHTADTAAKDMIEKNLQGILSTLAHDGIAVGGFSVSLRQRQDGGEAGTGGEGTSGENGTTQTHMAAAVQAGDGAISIFV